MENISSIQNHTPLDIQQSFSNHQNQSQDKIRDHQTSFSINSNLNKYRIHQKTQEIIENQNAIKKLQQNRIKFKKLKQKLINICFKHQQICLGKQVTSHNKPRLMKLSIELQKQVNNQVKDYISIQNITKQILKILQQKKQNDLHVIRQSRFIPSLMQLYKKILSLHKNQYRQSVRIIDQGNKILLILCSFSVNRQYMIRTNRLQIIMNLLNWSLNKKQQINECKYFLVFFNILCCLIDQKPDYQTDTILRQTIQFMFYSQITRKLRNLLQNTISQDTTCDDLVIAKYCLKFWLSLINLIDPQNQIRQIDDIQQQHLSYNVLTNNQLFVSYLPQFLFTLIFDKQKLLRQHYLSSTTISILIYIIKILNKTSKINISFIQKNITPQFLYTLRYLIIYSKQNYDQNQDHKDLLNQLIILVGFIAYINTDLQNKIHQFKIIHQICNLPIQYIMDKKLIQILNPTICSLIYDNKLNFKFVSNQMSLVPLKKYLNNEIQQIPEEKSGILSRKCSLSSMNSINTQCSSNIWIQKQMNKCNLRSRFGVDLWEGLLEEIERYE